VDWIGCGSEYTELSWIGLDWVIKLLDWVGLDLAKWTHVQLWHSHSRWPVCNVSRSLWRDHVARGVAASFWWPGHRGRDRRDVPYPEKVPQGKKIAVVIGIYERATNLGFHVQVCDKSSAVLLSEITNLVEPGTRVITDAVIISQTSWRRLWTRCGGSRRGVREFRRYARSHSKHRSAPQVDEEYHKELPRESSTQLVLLRIYLSVRRLIYTAMFSYTLIDSFIDWYTVEERVLYKSSAVVCRIPFSSIHYCNRYLKCLTVYRAYTIRIMRKKCCVWIRGRCPIMT